MASAGRVEDRNSNARSPVRNTCATISLTAIFSDFFKDYAAIERKRNIRPRHHVHYWEGCDNKNPESIIDPNPDCPFFVQSAYI